jgi:hypothetical protein
LFVDDEYSCKEIKSHLKKQLSQFKSAQSNLDKAKNSFLYVLEGVADFGVTKIVVKKVRVNCSLNVVNHNRFIVAIFYFIFQFYYQSASVDKVYPVEWEILVSPNGLKKRRTYKDERVNNLSDFLKRNELNMIGLSGHIVHGPTHHVWLLLPNISHLFLLINLGC